MKYTDTPADPDHAKALLDAWAEGLVRANRATIDRDPEAYPCCCGCGGFKLVPLKMTPNLIIGLVARGPNGLKRAKRGNAFELACFQCAQRRREGDEEAVVVTRTDECGLLECWVLRTQGDDENMTKYLPEALQCEGDACGCIEVEG